MIKFKRVFKLVCLFIIFTAPAFTVAASSYEGQGLSQLSEKGNVKYVEYLETIEFPELTAQPGQTISEEVQVREEFIIRMVHRNLVMKQLPLHWRMFYKVI